jgi:hypothetical protein
VEDPTQSVEELVSRYSSSSRGRGGGKKENNKAQAAQPLAQPPLKRPHHMKELRDLIKKALKDNTWASNGNDPHLTKHNATSIPDHPVPSQLINLLKKADLFDIIIRVCIIHYLNVFNVFRLMK